MFPGYILVVLQFSEMHLICTPAFPFIYPHKVKLVGISLMINRASNNISLTICNRCIIVVIFGIMIAILECHKSGSLHSYACHLAQITWCPDPVLTFLKVILFTTYT